MRTFLLGVQRAAFASRPFCRSVSIGGLGERFVPDGAPAWRVFGVAACCDRGLNDYLSSGQVLVGCEGNEWILPYVIKQCGAEALAYASDYPHEVDLVQAKRMIHETVERADLSHAEKAAVLGENAKRFFRLK